MSARLFVTHDGCSLAYEDCGSGAPLLWQHGLGADRRQTAEVFPQLTGIRRITLECRGHGGSEQGDPGRLSIAQFAEDAMALLDHLGVDKAIVGGISLGAAISLRLAVKHQQRVEALILARPAWVDESAQLTMHPYLTVGELLRAHEPKEALRKFEVSDEFAAVKAVSPDNATSLQSFFSQEGKERTVELLTRIPKDGPGLSADQIASISVPTMIIANGEEYVHPPGYAEKLRGVIPNSALKVITSKTVDKALYQSQFRDALASFLQDLWLVHS